MYPFAQRTTVSSLRALLLTLLPRRVIDDWVEVVASVVVKSDLSSVCDSALDSPFKLYALRFTLYALRFMLSSLALVTRGLRKFQWRDVFFHVQRPIKSIRVGSIPQSVDFLAVLTFISAAEGTLLVTSIGVQIGRQTKDFGYMGCRQLPSLRNTVNPRELNLGNCLGTCYVHNYKWAGVGNNICYCDNGDRGKRLDDDSCEDNNFICPASGGEGEDTEYCGSKTSLVLYATSD